MSYSTTLTPPLGTDPSRSLARKLLANGHAATLQCTLTIPYPGTPLFRELQANDGLTTLDWDEYDQRRAVTKTPLATEDEIKCAVSGADGLPKFIPFPPLRVRARF